MKSGSFALIDCLGFKGIWREDHIALMAKLKSIDKAANKAAHDIVNPDIKPTISDQRLEVKLLSDTIAISLTWKKNEGSKFIQLVTMALIVQSLMDLFLKDTPHLLLRGCITYGQHVTQKNFLVGPAVDDTAEYMNCAQGAFIWFLPPAADIIESKIETFYPGIEIVKKSFEALFPKYKVPIKDSHYLNTYVVNPIYDKSPVDSDTIINLYKKIMGINKIDIWLKRQHTLEFLDQCKKCNLALAETKIVE